MARPLIFALCLGLVASVPTLLVLVLVPNLAVASAMALGLSAIGAVGAWGLWQNRQRVHEQRVHDLEERRRRTAEEAADLQGLELSLLADLEEAEADLEAHQAVADSLSSAIHHTLSTVEAQLHERDERDLARHIEEALELVADARDFHRYAADSEAPAERFALFAAIDHTLMELRGASMPQLTWAIDDAVPSQAAGGPERLAQMLTAAANAAGRENEQDPHLSIGLLDRGETAGLVIAWAPMGQDEDELTTALGSRLSTALEEPALVAAERKSLTWWMQNPESSPPIVGPTLPDATVLVAASQARPRARVRRLLERWGLRVKTARTPEEALLRLRCSPFDIVLLDLDEQTLPTLEHIRADPALGAMPVLLLTPEIENVVWFAQPQDLGLVRHVDQKSLLHTVESVLQRRPPAPRPQSQAAQFSTRVLAMEPNPSLAAALVRAAADAGCELRVVATPDGLARAAMDHWDLVLIGRQAIDPAVAMTCLEGLDPAVPRLLVGPTVDGMTRNAARACGLTDAAKRPTDAQGLLSLISLTQPPVGERVQSYSMLSATAARKPS